MMSSPEWSRLDGERSAAVGGETKGAKEGSSVHPSLPFSFDLCKARFVLRYRNVSFTIPSNVTRNDVLSASAVRGHDP